MSGNTWREAILLDTHILIWLDLEPNRLGKIRLRLLKEMETTQSSPRGSTRPRIHQTFSLWLRAVAQHPAYRVMPIIAEVASESVQLGDLAPADPADHLIIATARCAGVALMTDDKRSGLVPVL